MTQIQVNLVDNIIIDYNDKYKDKIVYINGFIRRIRSGNNGNMVFIDIFDGTTINELKCIAFIENYNNNTLYNDNYILLTYEQLLNTAQLSSGCSVCVYGQLLESPSNTTQKYELQITHLLRINNVHNHIEFPIQKSNQKNLIALRSHPFMRVQTQITQALFRIRSKILFNIHKFFNDNNIPCLDPNILTANDCEGAGEAFIVSPSIFGKDNNEQDIQVGLTVSSQLPLEALAIGFNSVYTCQKSFRAEKSNTNKHLAEFLHIEYEQYFTDIYQLLDFTQKFIKYIIKNTLNDCQKEYEFLSSKMSPDECKNTYDMLTKLVEKDWKYITYEDAITTIQNDLKNKIQHNGKRLKMQVFPKIGEDLATEHEKYLVEKYDTFVAVTHWNAHIKSFYMMKNKDNNELCDNFDILAPYVGELFGGSMREWNYDKLKEEMDNRNMNINTLNWYLELRKNGGAPHGGWGMGFERLVMLMTGVSSVRDITCFPVYYNHCPY